MKDSGKAAVAQRAAGVWSPPEGVKAVVFDVVGTLIEPRPSVAHAYQHAAARHGIERDPETIRRRFAAAWRRQEMIDAAATPAFATSRSREAERWRAIVEDVFDGVPASGTIFADLWEHFGRVEAWQPIPAGREFVRRALDAKATVLDDTFTACVETEDWSPLERGVRERNVYAPGLGLVLRQTAVGDERMKLVKLIAP